MFDVAHGGLDVAVDKGADGLDQHGLVVVKLVGAQRYGHIENHIDTLIDALPAWFAVTLSGQISGGPYFDDLRVGDVFDAAPAVTLTSGAQRSTSRSSATVSACRWTRRSPTP